MTRLSDIMRTQRWDDYRYYHQSRVNQTLHLISALLFLVTYALIFKDPAMAGLLGWFAMLTRQTGHFFFEPNGYDEVNKVTNEYKESVKVGYNQFRKICLLFVWGSAPVVLFFYPTFFGLFTPPADRIEFIRHVGLVWLAVAFGGAMFRMIQLFIVRDVSTGFAWVLKVLTDPFHNVAIYWKSPYYLLRGDKIDSTIASQTWENDDEAEQAPRLT